ncbi:O-antigen ligase-like membrane protein [Methylosinus sp. sav-2]|uniref:O-antigen ligase family protein n=1 Tax=Methylosinus sp. sav-2 TaxID=2485168 RepID=UPI00047C996C|nr:O-antigen ligase family protein [Methylosinus sp. sav-2]TDX64258.1 O-antigen ligase-like membrane protein [Methylosinus sp. sav-2]
MASLAGARTENALRRDAAHGARDHLIGCAAALGALLIAGAVGPFLGAPARALYVLACAAVGWWTWRRGPSAHVGAALLLFLFTPFVRRLVDVRLGYDTSSLMLVGPLACLMAPLSHMLGLMTSAGRMRRMEPLLLVIACVVYAMILTLFKGEWMSAARDTVKWFAPLLYAMLLAETADKDEILAAVTNVFAIALPIIGVYGVVQYVDPAVWDRYWMQNAPITSIGQPVPYSVRVFSTMNAPAGFATFTAVGLLLVWFRKSDWLSQIATAPAALALFLSLYRTAWISLVVAMLFCALFRATRGRSFVMMIGLCAATIVALIATPFGESISARLATFTEGSRDGSARERIDQYSALWNLSDSSLIGAGFTTVDTGVAGSQPVDGMIIACWQSMGIVFGLICLFALVWVTVSAIVGALNDGRAESVMLGAFGAFFLVQLPLAGIGSGEAGFLFWTFMALALASVPAPGLRHGFDLRRRR